MRIFSAILLSAAIAGALPALAQTVTQPLPDPSHIPFTLLDNIPWTGDPARGEQQYKIFGDASKPGPYAFLLKWLPNHFSKPHFHTHSRCVTVLQGHWWVSSSNVYDPNKTYPLPPGTVACDMPNTVHWDGAKDETVILELAGEGPETNNNVDENGKVIPPGPPPGQRQP